MATCLLRRPRIDSALTVSTGRATISAMARRSPVLAAGFAFSPSLFQASGGLRALCCQPRSFDTRSATAPSQTPMPPGTSIARLVMSRNRERRSRRRACSMSIRVGANFAATVVMPGRRTILGTSLRTMRWLSGSLALETLPVLPATTSTRGATPCWRGRLTPIARNAIRSFKNTTRQAGPRSKIVFRVSSRTIRLLERASLLVRFFSITRTI